VFTRRFERDGIDSAAVLVLDMSGSMSSDLADNIRKMDCAAACTWALAETLIQAGVDVAILGFDNDLFRIRDFGSTPALKTRAALERIRTGGSTNDYAAIRLAHQMLLRHHATRRVAFVLGDGIGDRANAARQVKQGENLGITTIGVGIGYDVRGVYGAGSVRVDRPADLGTVAFRQIKAAA
jgi:Mg-chelatase subunit ChlD